MKGKMRSIFGLACVVAATAAQAYWTDMGTLTGGFVVSGSVLTAQNSASNPNALSMMPTAAWLPILGGSQGQMGIGGQFGTGAAAALPVYRYDSVASVHNLIGTGQWGMVNYSHNLNSAFQPSVPTAQIGHTHIRGSFSTVSLDGSGNLSIEGNSDGFYYWYLNNAQTLFAGLNNGAGGTFTGRYRIIGTLDAQSGWANLSGGRFQIESVPEPATMAALAMGAMAVVRRRRAR